MKKSFSIIAGLLLLTSCGTENLAPGNLNLAPTVDFIEARLQQKKAAPAPEVTTTTSSSQILSETQTQIQAPDVQSIVALIQEEASNTEPDMALSLLPNTETAPENSTEIENNTSPIIETPASIDSTGSDNYSSASIDSTSSDSTDSTSSDSTDSTESESEDTESENEDESESEDTESEDGPDSEGDD